MNSDQRLRLVVYVSVGVLAVTVVLKLFGTELRKPEKLTKEERCMRIACVPGAPDNGCYLRAVCLSDRNYNWTEEERKAFYYGRVPGEGD